MEGCSINGDNIQTIYTMVFKLHGYSLYYAHTWSKSGISVCLKAFGYIERVVKSDFFSEKTYYTSYVRNMF